jgi:hypothetical protein
MELTKDRAWEVYDDVIDVGEEAQRAARLLVEFAVQKSNEPTDCVERALRHLEWSARVHGRPFTRGVMLRACPICWHLDPSEADRGEIQSLGHAQDCLLSEALSAIEQSKIGI